jgi:hypothetical protein
MIQQGQQVDDADLACEADKAKANEANKAKAYEATRLL